MTDEMKKVLMFSAPGVGGAERMTCTISKMLLKENFEVIFYVIEEYDRKTEITDFIPKGAVVKYMTTDNVIFNFLKIIHKEKPSYVFASSIGFNVRLCLCRLFYPKLKVIVRNNIYLYLKSNIWKYAIRFTYNLAKNIIAQTEEMKDELVKVAGVKSDRIKVLHNPLDKEYINKCLEAPSPYAKSQSKIFVAVGRFSEEKGFDILVRSFKKLLSAYSDAKLYIVGRVIENAYFNSVKQYVDDNAIRDRVFFVGLKQNPYIYIKHADCFVLSSRSEGLPNVLIESLFIGTPVAATRCIPIIERIVNNEETGYLAEPDDVNSLSEAMIKAVSLGRITTTYKSAEEDDFVRMFLD